MQQNTHFWEVGYAKFLTYPLFIEIAIVIIVISVLMFLMANALLSLERIRTSYLTQKIGQANRLINRQLTDNLMMPDKVTDQEFDALVYQIKQFSLKNSLTKQVVMKQIIFYHKNFTDHTQMLLAKLYVKLNLVEGAIKKLKKRKWEQKAKGLREIQEMVPNRNMQPYIYPLLNSNNPDLRVEAQATHIRLNKIDPYGFLDTATEELLPWHQILLHELIANTSGLPLPNTSLYLKSKNPSVVSFAIKLVIYFHQLNSVPQLITLLDHPLQQIRAEVVAALGKLNVEESEELMIEKFPLEDLKLQLNILASIGEIASGNQLDFLEDQFLHANEFVVIKTAACALLRYPYFDKQDTVDMFKDVSALHETIISHCTNSLIRN